MTQIFKGLNNKDCILRTNDSSVLNCGPQNCWNAKGDQIFKVLWYIVSQYEKL